MSDRYVPTTEEVRDAWRNSTFDALDGTEFDRWLADVKAEAWEEGERVGYENAMTDQRGLQGHGHYTPNPYREQETP